MRKILLMAVLAATTLMSCQKDTESFNNISTPRTNPVPDELVGRWAITSISGSTVYDIPAGTTWNTSEVFLGYQINKDGTIREDGYGSTYSYGVSTWAKWTAYGSVVVDGSAITFHRARGSYTSSRNSSPKNYGAAEVYPNKSFAFTDYEVDIDNQGKTVLYLLHEDGSASKYYKQ
ncbi:MAG TPA: hypothetical protein VHK69_17345 [Chitinophagaceae bacterium]|jgi:hypothetical protein|nr:hypothetical protein [Chitinophagaceae bacterium]